MEKPNSAPLANETISLLFEGYFVHRSSNGAAEEKIPFGYAPILLALGILPQVPGTGDIVVRAKPGEILSAAGFRKCADGNYSSFHYQCLHKALDCFERCGFISLPPGLEPKQAIDITLRPCAFGGLSRGGQGRCFIHLERVVDVIHKALTPETRTPAAIPVLAYLARHQTEVWNKFLPSIEVKISLYKILPKLGFAGRNHTRHRQALFEAGQFLLQEGALLVAPGRDEVFGTGNTVLTYVKNPAFFPISEEQRKILAKKGQCLPKKSAAAKPKPTSLSQASGTQAATGRSELMQAFRKNRQAKEPDWQVKEPIRQVAEQIQQTNATEIVMLDDILNEPDGVPAAIQPFGQTVKEDHKGSQGAEASCALHDFGDTSFRQTRQSRAISTGAPAPNLPRRGPMGRYRQASGR